MENHHSSSGKSADIKLTAEAARQFQEGIGLLLSRWTALQMAVQNEWGGPHTLLRSKQIQVDVFSLFTQSKETIYVDNVEDMLDEAMLSLGVEVDDGSIEEISEKLMLMHEECLEGNYSSIQRLRETNTPRGAVPNVPQIMDDSGSDDNDSDNEHSVDNCSAKMVVDGTPSHSIPNRSEMMVDDFRPKQSAEEEDGWTVVQCRRNRGRRN